MAVALEVKLDDAQLRAALARAENVENGALHPAWDAIGEAMVSKTQMRFREQKGPDGAAWLPSKAALRENRKTLIDTARLMGSFVHNAFDNGVEWGTNVVYAAVHQFGATLTRGPRKQTIYRRFDERTGELGTKFVKKKRSNFASEHDVAAHSITIPARPFLGIDQDDIAEAETTLAKYLGAHITGSAAAFMEGGA